MAAGPQVFCREKHEKHEGGLAEIGGHLRMAVEAGGWLGLNASGTPEVPASAAEVGGLEPGVAAELFAFAFHRNPARLQHVGIGGNFKREVGVLLH